MDWPRVEVAHRPYVGIRAPECGPRVTIEGEKIRLAVPDRMPLPMLAFAIAMSVVALGFAMFVSYMLAPEFPGGPAGAWALGGVVSFFAVGGVLVGFIGGWYMGKEKGPLAVHRLGSGEIEFPQMKRTIKLDDILALDYVIGGYGWGHPGQRGAERLCQMFCRVRDGDEVKRVIVQSGTHNFAKRWKAFAREVGLELEEHKLPRHAWPQID